jgi:hypothetical protein
LFPGLDTFIITDHPPLLSPICCGMIIVPFAANLSLPHAVTPTQVSPLPFENQHTRFHIKLVWWAKEISHIILVTYVSWKVNRNHVWFRSVAFTIATTWKCTDKLHSNYKLIMYWKAKTMPQR